MILRCSRLIRTVATGCAITPGAAGAMAGDNSKVRMHPHGPMFSETPSVYTSGMSAIRDPPLVEAKPPSEVLQLVGVDAVLGELLAQGVAVDAEDLGGADLVAGGLAEHRAQ